jgi:RNA polymerase sigma-70 factor (ECF subfamily)
MTLEDYNECVDEIADGLYRFALKMTGDVDTAKDTVQEAYEKMWINRLNVQAGKAKSFLFTVAYHSVIDRKRRLKLSERYVSDMFNESCHSQYSDLNEILHRAADRLPDIQKSVLLLRDYEGYTYEEISNITGLHSSQVKVYIHRARLRMRQYIGNINALI